jgi:hypothetical protein
MSKILNSQIRYFKNKIKGKLFMENKIVVKFEINLIAGEENWSQWGADSQILWQTQSFVENLFKKVMLEKGFEV